MTLDSVIKEFEDKFVRVRQPEARAENKDVSLICSGGTCKVGDVLPALYSSADKALKAWLDMALSYITNDSTTLEWVYKPEFMEFQMTMADRIGRHRLVTNRFAVKSQFFVQGEKNG